MSNDYEILMKKFYNFKKYVKDNCKEEEVIQRYESMTDAEFMLFGSCFLLPNKDKLDVVVSQMSDTLKMTEPDQLEKIRKYLECFCDYLDQLNSDEFVTDTIKNAVAEKLKE